jgi:hypothetical protein
MLKKILLIFILIILFFNKKILSKIIFVSFEKWLDKYIVVENIEISYQKGFIKFKDVNVFENKETKNLLLFNADEIFIEFDLSSLFSTLIVIKNLNFSNAKLYINFETSKNKELINDNLSILDNINNKNPKIYPKKIVDINFLVKKFKIMNAKVRIIENNKKEIEIMLSNMNFASFGNEKNFQHYKDVIKIILTDIYMRIPDQNLRNLIKNTYQIK